HPLRLRKPGRDSHAVATALVTQTSASTGHECSRIRTEVKPLKKIAIHLMSLAAITAGIYLTQALAQNGPPDPARVVQARVDRMNEELRLTKAQQEQITDIYMNAMTANRPLQAGMRTARELLAAAIKSNDTNSMSQAANTIGTLTAEIPVNNAKAEAAVYAALTPEQQAKFQPSTGMGGYGAVSGGNAADEIARSSRAGATRACL